MEYGLCSMLIMFIRQSSEVDPWAEQILTFFLNARYEVTSSQGAERDGPCFGG